MADRILDATPSELSKVSGRKLTELVLNAEGRTLMCEVVAPRAAAVPAVTNAELAGAFGADLLLLNGYDTDHPVVAGLPEFGESMPGLAAVRQLTGRAVGLNLEPVPEGSSRLPPGRTLTTRAVRRAVEQGAQFIVLTGNPHTGVTNATIRAAIALVRAETSDLMLVAGKMHGAGVAGEQGEHVVDETTANQFISEGADVVLLPCPGTVPGFTVERVAGLITAVHAAGGLALTAVGTCQEGADVDTVRHLALGAKMAGADLHHLGDCGFSGMAPPDNILAYSVVVKGRTHTYRRMAASLLR